MAKRKAATVAVGIRDPIIFRFPELIANGSNDRLKTVIITVEEVETSSAENLYIIHMRHGLVGGALTDNTRDVNAGKNLGKANETTAREQAILEATAHYNKKLKEGYLPKGETVELESTKLLPMLALKYTERKSSIVFPCYVQPKLDGVRCVFHSNKTLSREGNEFDTIDHLKRELNLIEKVIGDPLDGELYTHNQITFQETLSAVKRYSADTLHLSYWIYDIIAPELSYAERLVKIQSAVLTKTWAHVHYVPTFEAFTEADIEEYLTQFIQEGYEGVIIRNAAAPYKLKGRSKDLQKYKNFDDHEFKIVDYGEATGNDKGTVIYVCVVDDTRKTFNVRPRGSRELRARLFEDGAAHINRYLTVRHQGFTTDGLPRFPVGICPRDGWY